MKYPVHITAAELREGVAKRTGNAYKMVQVQGVLDIEGDQQIFRTVLPQGAEVPAPGKYLAEFMPGVNNQTMELTGSIISLEAVSRLQPKP